MSNLPPGVTDSMIPGNRPEDALYERVLDAMADLLPTFGVPYESLTDRETEELDRIASNLTILIQAAYPEVT